MKTLNRWNIQATHEQMQGNAAVREIASALHLRLPTAFLLYNRGCQTPADAKAFLAKETEQMHDPFDMADMDEAVPRLLEAVENKENIVIYGDYDVDGVTSVSSLYLYLQSLGGKVTYYIPSRTGEGYGMSECAIRKLAEAGTNLIVTVDTGVTAVQEARLITELGMELIITDHHECCGELPEAVAVVNPKRPDCPYPFKELAGVGVVFKFLCAMESVLHPEMTMTACVLRVSQMYGDLVAIGTIADVMPIRDENRLIVSYGLQLMEKNPRPGLIELLEATQTEGRPTARRKITATLIGYTVAPRINAAGRIRNATLAVDLFLAEDCESARPIARQLCDINRERQNEENKIIEEAYRQIVGTHDFEREPIIILDDETWHHGIIGIVASRITERFNCPSILISFEGGENVHTPDAEEYGNDIGKGSGRSIKGMNLVDALSACGDLLEKYGGHELAAGLSIKRNNLPAFRERLNAYARECLQDVDRQPVVEAECELLPSDMNMEQAGELYYLEPYGVSNPTPLFYIDKVPMVDLQMVGGGKHTRMSLKVGKSIITAMFFRKTVSDIDLYPGDLLDVIFTLDINEFQGNRNLQMIVKDVRLHATHEEIETSERFMYTTIRNRISQCLQQIECPVVPLSIAQIIAYVPTRQDFATVYSTLKKELQMHHEVFSLRALRHDLITNNPGFQITYVKLRFILDILRDLSLMGVEESSGEIFTFTYIPVQGKTSLETSRIYKQLLLDYPRE